LREADTEAEIARKVTDGVRGLFQTSEASKQTSEVSKTSEVYAEEFLPFIGRLMSIHFGNELDKRLDFATPDQIKHQTIMRLKDLFETLARKQPLMLILEDLHWADDLSLDLISLLMDSLATTPLMLLCVYRPEGEHRVWQLSSLAGRKCLDRYTELTLKQLSSHESRRLVEELLTIDNLPESVKGMILRKSEGNPFFIEEVIRSLIDRDLVYREGDRWVARAEISDINVPDTIQSVVLSRVDRLQAEARYVLQCASVIGRLFKYRLLEHLAHQERDLDRHLSEFEARDLVYAECTVPELEYAFKHAFTQEATYQGILEGRRQAFHHQIAEGIERLYRERLEEYYEELAHHYSSSGDAEKAVEYLLKAGEKAKGSYANEVAIAHFQRALEIIQQSGMERKEWKLRALRGLGIVYYEGQPAKAEQTLQQAIALAKEINLPPRQIVRLYYYLLEVMFWLGKSADERIHEAEIGLEVLGDDTECVEAALMNDKLALAYSHKGNLEKGREFIRRNMTFIRKLEYAPELRSPYIFISFYLAGCRDLQAAWDWTELLAGHANQSTDLKGLAFAWKFQDDMLLGKGDSKNYRLLSRKALEIYERIGDIKNMGSANGTFARGLFRFGDIDEAEERAYTALRATEKAATPHWNGNAHNQLGSIAMSECQWEKAISHYRKSLEKWQHEALAYLDLGRAYMKKGDFPQALEFLKLAAGRALGMKGSNFFQDEMHWLPNALWGLEATHLASGTPEAFIDFCHTFKAEHADAVEKLSLRGWYLAPAQPADQFPCRAFADDFAVGPIHPSWTWIDEFNDFAYRLIESGGVELSAANGRDFDGLNVSAPRFTREVSGDFAVEVCLSPASDEKPMMGGLLIHQDKDNFLRFEIGVHGENEVRLHGYVGGVQQIVGRGILQDFRSLKDFGSLLLRLERISDEFSAYCSADGKNWFTCGAMALPLNAPISLGICAIGMIDRTIYCGAYPDGTATVFRGFKLWVK